MNSAVALSDHIVTLLLLAASDGAAEETNVNRFFTISRQQLSIDHTVACAMIP